MGANAIDLTTVAVVNAILGQQPTTDAAEIQREITAYSQNILTRTSRSFLSGFRSYSERYNGNGSQELPVVNYPILAVASLSVNGIAIPASPDYQQSGYVIDTEGSISNIAIIGGNGSTGWPDERWVVPGGWGSYGNAPPLGAAPYRFAQGIQNVAVRYTAGYTQDVYSEPHTVPDSPGPYTIAVANAATFWADAGVTLADGTPLCADIDGAPASTIGVFEIDGVPVASGGAGCGNMTPSGSGPGPGQYQPPTSQSVPRGTYTFNAAQAGADVLISYSYGAPPLDLSEAAARLVAEMYRKRQWIGQASQIQPGVGTAAYSKLEVELGTALTIQRYRRMFPA